MLPDLRYTWMLKDPAAWYQTVLDGARMPLGMVAFKEEIGEVDADKIRAYVIHRAHEDMGVEGTAKTAH